jgi:hypothetical protein
MPNYAQRANELADRFTQQLAQFRTRPSRVGYEALERTRRQFTAATEEAGRALSAANAAMLRAVSTAYRSAKAAEGASIQARPYGAAATEGCAGCGYEA